MVRESIEAKLGMTIEEYYDSFFKKMSGTVYETDEIHPLHKLTDEELDFLLIYVEEHGINKFRCKRVS